MRVNIGCVALILGATGFMASATAGENIAGLPEKRGLPPIVRIVATPPSTNPVVMVADNSQQARNVLGVCEAAHGKTVVVPTLDAGSYMAQFKSTDNFSYGATAKIIQQPAHGTLDLTDVTDPNIYQYTYTPNQLPPGTKDSFVISVENKGITVKIHYYIYIDILGPNEPPATNWCGDKTFWKISQDPNGNPILIAINYQSPIIDVSASTTDTAASTLESGILKTLSVDPSSVTFNLANLTGGAAGQESGNICRINNFRGNWFTVDRESSKVSV